MKNLESSLGTLSDSVYKFAEIKNDNVIIKDYKELEEKFLGLLKNASDNTDYSRALYYLLLCAAFQKDIYLSSLHEFYKGEGDGSIKNPKTVPVFDITNDSIDMLCSIFKTNIEKNSPPFCFGFHPENTKVGNYYLFISKILFSAIKENYQGPIFLHVGDFKFTADRFITDRDNLMNELKEKLKQYIKAGFYNLTLDSSELFEEDRENELDKVLMNIKMAAMATNLWIRNFQLKGITVAVGVVLDLSLIKLDHISFVKDYLNRLIKEGSRLRFNTFGEDIIKLSIKGMTEISDLESLKLLQKVIRKDFMMGGLAIDIGEVDNFLQINSYQNLGFCEIHMKLKESLNKRDPYLAIFEAATNKQNQLRNVNIFLRPEKLPNFNEV